MGNRCGTRTHVRWMGMIEEGREDMLSEWQGGERLPCVLRALRVGKQSTPHQAESMLSMT